MVDPVKPQVNAWKIINDEVEQTYIATSVLMVGAKGQREGIRARWRGAAP